MDADQEQRFRQLATQRGLPSDLVERKIMQVKGQSQPEIQPKENIKSSISQPTTQNPWETGLGGFVAGQLPTIGGTIGMLGGGALGIETGPGALVTAAAGGGIGSAAGEKARQWLTGKEDIGKIAGEAALGAIAAPIGEVTGRVLGGMAERILGKTVGEAISRETGRLTKPVSDWLSQFSATRSEIGGRNLLDTAARMINHGFKNYTPDTLQRVVDAVTGENGIITKLTKQAVATIGGKVDLSAGATAAKDILDRSTVTDAMKDKVLTIINKGLPFYKGQATKSAVDATEAIGWIRTLEKDAAQYLVPNSSVEDKFIGKAYRNAADAIMNQIEKVAGDTNVLDRLKIPEVISQLQKISPSIADEFMDAKTISELRSIAAPFVNTGKLIEATGRSEVSQLLRVGQQSTKAMEDIAKLNPANWIGLAGREAAKKAAPIVQKALSETSPTELLKSPLVKGIGSYLTQMLPRNTLVSNLVGYQKPDYASETKQLPNLPPGLKPGYKVEDYRNDLDKVMQSNIPNAQKTAYRSYLKDRFNSSQAALKGEIQSHKLTTNERQYMDDAPMLMSMINRLRAQIKTTPPSAWYKIPGVAGVTGYVNPQFAAMEANMNLHQTMTDRIMVGGRLTGQLIELLSKSVPRPGDSKQSALTKLDQYEENLTNKYKQLSKDYAISMESPMMIPGDTTGTQE